MRLPEHFVARTEQARLLVDSCVCAMELSLYLDNDSRNKVLIGVYIFLCDLFLLNCVFVFDSLLQSL